jgi:hypothetical protein
MAVRGPQGPGPQTKRGWLWLNEGSCVRLRRASPNHDWAYDFVHELTYDGQAMRLLTVMYEYTRECVAIRVAPRLSSGDVPQQLTDLFVARYARVSPLPFLHFSAHFAARILRLFTSGLAGSSPPPRISG